MIARVLCSWLQDGGNYLPSIKADYNVRKVTDVTGQSADLIVSGGDPNALIVEIDADDDVIDSIDEDDEYFVLWSE